MIANYISYGMSLQFIDIYILYEYLFQKSSDASQNQKIETYFKYYRALHENEDEHSMDIQYVEINA